MFSLLFAFPSILEVCSLCVRVIGMCVGRGARSFVSARAIFDTQTHFVCVCVCMATMPPWLQAAASSLCERRVCCDRGRDMCTAEIKDLSCHTRQPWPWRMTCEICWTFSATQRQHPRDDSETASMSTTRGARILPDSISHQG